MDLKKFANRQVATVAAESSIRDAAKIMRADHVGDLVVTETGGIDEPPIGILTDRDIVVSTIALGIDASALLVKDVMSEELITAKATDDVDTVIGLMREYGCRRIPLVNDEGFVQGIVTMDDVTRIVAAELTAITGLPKRQQGIETMRRRNVS